MEKEKLCKQLINGKKCNGQVVIHPDKELEGKVFLCKNPKCSRYYICHCGMEFGRHYETKTN